MGMYPTPLHHQVLVKRGDTMTMVHWKEGSSADIKTTQELLEHIKRRKDEAGQIADASYDKGHKESATFWRGYGYSLESLLNELTLDVKEAQQ